MRTLIACIGVWSGCAFPVSAQTDDLTSLIAALSDPDKADEAADQLIRKGSKALPALIGEAREGRNIFSRTWAIACLREIGNADAVSPLSAILEDAKEKDLLRIAAAKTMLDLWPEEAMERILKLLPSLQQNQFGRNPGWGMPQQPPTAAGNLFTEISRLISEKGSTLAPALLKACYQNGDAQSRNFAAAFLGGLAANSEPIRTAILDHLSYSHEKEKAGLPWKGGALFLPGINWSQDELCRLTASLIGWFIVCEEKGDQEGLNQVRNNLWNTAQRLGMQVNNGQMSGKEWVDAYLRRFSGKSADFAKHPRMKAEVLRLLIRSLEENLRQHREILRQLREISGAGPGDSPEEWTRWLEEQDR